MATQVDYKRYLNPGGFKPGMVRLDNGDIFDINGFNQAYGSGLIENRGSAHTPNLVVGGSGLGNGSANFYAALQKQAGAVTSPYGTAATGAAPTALQPTTQAPAAKQEATAEVAPASGDPNAPAVTVNTQGPPTTGADPNKVEKNVTPATWDPSKGAPAYYDPRYSTSQGSANSQEEYEKQLAEFIAHLNAGGMRDPATGGNAVATTPGAFQPNTTQRTGQVWDAATGTFRTQQGGGTYDPDKDPDGDGVDGDGNVSGRGPSDPAWGIGTTPYGTGVNPYTAGGRPTGSTGGVYDRTATGGATGGGGSGGSGGGGSGGEGGSGNPALDWLERNGGPGDPSSRMIALSRIDPNANLRGQQVLGGEVSPYLSEAAATTRGADVNARDPIAPTDLTGAMAAVQRAQQFTSGEAPDRSAIARDTFNLLRRSTEPEFEREIQNVGRKAATFGRIGSGVTTSNLGDVQSERERFLSESGERLSLDAADKTLRDRLDLSGENRSIAALLDSLNRANRAEQVGERTYGTEADAMKARFALERAGMLSGIGDRQFGQGAALRNEVRTERDFQNAIAQLALENRLRQLTMEDDFATTDLQRRLAPIELAGRFGFQNNPWEALFAAARNYA